MFVGFSKLRLFPTPHQLIAFLKGDSLLRGMNWFFK